MRRIVSISIMASLFLLYFAPVAEAGRLTVTERQRRGRQIKIIGRTGCTSEVHIRARLVGPKTAINPKTVGVKDSNFRYDPYIRSNGGLGLRNIDAKCVGNNGHIGDDRVNVLPFTGLPVLPQLLLGVGLLGVGALLLRGGRRLRPEAADPPPTG